jgi:hypothetical protein
MRTSTRQTVRLYIEANPGATLHQVVAGTGIDQKAVDGAICNLRDARDIFTANPGNRPARYTTERPANPKLTTPVNGPGHTPRALPVLDKPTNVPHKPGTVGGSYLGLELQPYEGRPGANDAFDCPSIVNGVAVERVRPSIICAGARNWGSMNVGRPSRLA